MKIIIILYILVVIAIFLFLSQIQISFSPFTLKLPAWRVGLGYVFLMSSIILISSHYQDKGFKDGYDTAKDNIEKIVNNKLKNNF